MKHTHSQLGEITLNKSSRATRISLRVLSTGEVRLTYPKRASTKDALRFLEEKMQWVKEAKAKVLSRIKIIEMPYATRTHSLKLEPQPSTVLKAKLTDNQLIISYPNTLNYRESAVQDFIKKSIIELWRLEAKSMLPKKLDALAREHNFKYSGVGIRNTRTRWGSCSASNSISLSVSLMSLPDHLIDYILLHELCHTVHKNHGAEFYRLLDKVCRGRHKELQLELKRRGFGF